MPLKCLATMIARSSVFDVQDVLRPVLTTDYLGGIDKVSFEEYEKYYPWRTVKRNAQEEACQLNLTSQFGL